MRILRSKYAGACYGVKRALKMVQELPGEAPVRTLGPLIHNPQVVAELKSQGIESVESVDAVESGTLVIRSHGVSPEVIEAAHQRGLVVLDATCPHVTKAQQAASDLSQNGYRVFVVGEQGHPEVEGISAYAGTDVLVVQDPADLPPLAPGEHVGLVVQTTQTPEALARIVQALEERDINLSIRNTICSATRQRQEAAFELAGQVDVMLVVGGRNSGNTTRLTEICAQVCPQTYHLESPDELQREWFDNAQTVGITGGASTPESQIAATEERLRALIGEHSQGEKSA
ncbi:MAG: 4-hydroxy-3-methylbut-2-enyl diphosphate reductase, partial [Coriobacteriia bacterium]|nr:4-hydroxy-3-methylbut-2-enyl diphosphate reductase [Coriobacteriia bacterium]